MMRLARQSVVCLLVFAAITGIAYPLAVTGVAQLAFPHQANGSLILSNGKVVGSDLIGQPFNNPKYFLARPSATSPTPYNAANSSGSNLGPLNPALMENVKARIEQLRNTDTTGKPWGLVPVDLVTASGSGLDPDISPAAAQYQIARVAKTRNLEESKVRELVAKYTKDRQLGFLGEPRVNVLELNLALDNLKNK